MHLHLAAGGDVAPQFVAHLRALRQADHDAGKRKVGRRAQLEAAAGGSQSTRVARRIVPAADCGGAACHASSGLPERRSIHRGRVVRVGAACQITTLTRRPGTTMTFLGTAPSASFTNTSLASAAASIASFACARGHQDRAAQLAVDLQHELDLVLLQRCGIVLWPRCVEQFAEAVCVPQLGPQRVRDVRRGRGRGTRSRMPKPSASASLCAFAVRIAP